jgi:RNA-directed DNA polymerase
LCGGGLHDSIFHCVISIPNLLRGWEEFRRGKRRKDDVAVFELSLEENIFALHDQLASKKYRHDPYKEFHVSDPKRRHIHKASVRDRVLHQAFHRVTSPIFDKHFIYDSYSSRDEHGTHLAVRRAFEACRKATQNWRKDAYVLKCDVRKFFDSIDHGILRKLIETRISGPDTMNIVDTLFASFEKQKGKGLPLGNVTSQLFGNIYLNELDQYVKHVLKVGKYFRYCDDFILIHENEAFLEDCMEKIGRFLQDRLLLELHPKKVEIRRITQGVDFLGYVIIPHMVLIRTRTRKRIRRNVRKAWGEYVSGGMSKEGLDSMLASYLGLLSHCRDKELEAFIGRYMPVGGSFVVSEKMLAPLTLHP